MIHSHPSAPDGIVLRPDRYTESLFTPGSVVLCRNTAPLIGFAFSLLQRDIPCKVLGRDIGAQLAGIVKQMRTGDLSDLQVRLAEWRTRELDRAEREDRSPEHILDQFQCIMFFISGLDHDSQTVASLLAKIDLMFSDSGPTTGVTLSTVHRSKGLEYPTVFILDMGKYMPSRFATQPWQLRQERNLCYVAITRAMEKLVYINSDSWEEKK